MPANYAPDPKMKFTFGLWTVGNIGRDPFGGPTREPISPVEIADLLGEVGAYGVNFHDNDLVPIDASASQRDDIVRSFKKALKDNGLVCPMATTNLFGDPVFKDGAFTSNNARIRAYAIQKTMRAMDLGAEMGAKAWRRTPRKTPSIRSSGFARPSISSANIASSRGMAINLPSKPSPTSRAGIFISR